MNPVSIALTIALCVFLLIAPRRYMIFPFIVAACFVPMDQRIIILSFDFTLLRLLILTGVIRLVIQNETRTIEWNLFDKLILYWILVGSFVYVIRVPSVGSIIYKSGVMFDTLGTYWICRTILRTWEDIISTVKFLAYFAILTAPLIALESLLKTNLFSVFGHTAGAFHRGRFRAAGPFPHYIILGCFWATLIPIFYSWFKANRNKRLFVTAIIACLCNVFFSASSTPIMTVLSAFIFWNFFNYRVYGRVIFYSTCLGLLVMHIIMKAPVWHIIARVNVFGGSTGWHRYFLFDNFIKHASEWFWFGTNSTSHWGHGQSDLTNQFVLEGVRGGSITLLIFIILIYQAVRIPGVLSLKTNNPEIKWFNWGLCVCMLSHFITFWGVSYFGQINMLLCLVFSFISFALESPKFTLTQK